MFFFAAAANCAFVGFFLVVLLFVVTPVPVVFGGFFDAPTDAFALLLL
jgi:hypothetical protein